MANLKKQQEYLFGNLFEPASTTPPKESSAGSPASADRAPTETPAATADLLACPRCGNRSQPAAHPQDHDGKTRYCIFCVEEGEPHYFTPGVDVSPGQQIVKEAFGSVAPETLQAIDKELGIHVAPEPIDLFGNPIEKETSGALAERFIVPPFSVLDARQGYWKTRKTEWIALGITSEDGRGENRLGPAPAERAMNSYKKPKGLLNASTEYEWGEEYEGGNAWAGSGTSIFDPVLCELAYRWFTPASGKILDPFAGGSVRGIVAEKLGYHYTGIELRAEQIAANRAQAEKIGCSPNWIHGDSFQMNKLVPALKYEEMFDMVFTCPPYYDLEEYSESNQDGSAKQTYEEFLAWYKEIFKHCKERLKWNRFLVVVVGEIRDENGFYRNFVGDTISCMLELGFKYYNEAILVTAIGSLPLRVNGQFGGYRKLGKTHQNVLVFYNGKNCDQIAEKFGNLL